MFARTTLVTFAHCSIALSSIALSLLASACSRRAPAGVGGGAALMQNALRASALEVVAEEHALREPLERAAAHLRAAGPHERFDAHVVDAASAQDQDVPRVVFGTRASSTAQRLIALAGVQAIGDAAHPEFTYAGLHFADPNHVAIATFEDPDRPGLPVSIVFANDPRVAAQFATELAPSWRPWIRVLRAHDLLLTGAIGLDGSPRLDDLARPGLARRTLEATLTTVASETNGLAVRAPVGTDPVRLARYCTACRSARQRSASWSSPGTALPVARLVAWSHPEDYLQDGDLNRLSRFDPIDLSTSALMLGGLDDGGAAVARAGAWAALGSPSEPWMDDAAGVEAAWSWWGRPLDPWLAHTGKIGRELSTARIVAAQAHEEISAHVLAPRRAALWRFLRETRGDTFVRELWRGTRGLELDAAFDARFQAWIDARLATAAVDHPNRRGLTRKVDGDGQPLRGIGTCDENAVEAKLARHGYGTRAFDASLEVAATNGANALLVTAFTRDEPGLAPLFGDENWRVLAPREGDVRIVSALLAGSARKMRTLFAPHLVTGEGGTWFGGWTQSDAATWTAFFDHYAGVVQHQGLVAELGGAHVLSIGTGMLAVSSTDLGGRRTNPSEVEWKSAGWTRVIRAARAAFPGYLTYSACNVQEVEAITFWKELDFVGFELWPLLPEWRSSAADRPRDEMASAIDASLAALERAARASGKRALITQASFSPDLLGSARNSAPVSTSRAWQAQQFRELGSQLQTWSGRSLLAGLFAWRYSGEQGEREHAAVIDAPVVSAAVRELLLGL